MQELVRGLKSTNAATISMAAYAARRAWLGSVVRGAVAVTLVECMRYFEQEAKCDVPALQAACTYGKEIGKALLGR